MRGEIQQGQTRMSAAEFRSKFGAKVNENPPRSRVQNPKLEPTSQALAGSSPGEKDGAIRPVVLITSFRCGTPLDATNLRGGVKALEDQLVESGLIPDDSEEAADIQVKQVRVLHRFEERTEITIEYPCAES